MKRLLLILIVTLSFQSLAKADDIRDFQIEGMSIGDSLLDYFNKNEIKNNIKSFNNSVQSDKFINFEIYKEDFKLEKYDAIMIQLRKNDKNFKIFSIAGVIIFENDINKCLFKLKEIENDLSKTFNNLKKKNYGFTKAKSDKTGKSKFYEIEFKFLSKDEITIQCYDWSKDIGYLDHLRLGMHTKEYIYWINNEKYN